MSSITGHYEAPGDRVGFDLRAIDQNVVIDLPRMYGPFLYRHSSELFHGVKALDRRIPAATRPGRAGP